MRAEIHRFGSTPEQTLGKLFLFDDDGKQVFKCVTLELPWKDNESRVSCIPTGTYQVRFRDGVKEGSRTAQYNHFHVQNVPDRSWILIHLGNFNTDILGCILVGSGITFVNPDNNLDVSSSALTLEKLLKHAPEGFEMEIK